MVGATPRFRKCRNVQAAVEDVNKTECTSHAGSARPVVRPSRPRTDVGNLATLAGRDHLTARCARAVRHGWSRQICVPPHPLVGTASWRSRRRRSTRRRRVPLSAHAYIINTTFGVRCRRSARHAAVRAALVFLAAFCASSLRGPVGGGDLSIPRARRLSRLDEPGSSCALLVLELSATGRNPALFEHRGGSEWLCCSVAFWTCCGDPRLMLATLRCLSCSPVFARPPFITVLIPRRAPAAAGDVFHRCRRTTRGGGVVEEYIKTLRESVYDELLCPPSPGQVRPRARPTNPKNKKKKKKKKKDPTPEGVRATAIPGSHRRPTVAADVRRDEAPPRVRAVARCAWWLPARDDADEVPCSCPRAVQALARRSRASAAMLSRVCPWWASRSRRHARAALAPGGLSHARDLCQRLRAAFPIGPRGGRWSLDEDVHRYHCAAGSVPPRRLHVIARAAVLHYARARAPVRPAPPRDAACATLAALVLVTARAPASSSPPPSIATGVVVSLMPAPSAARHACVSSCTPPSRPDGREMLASSLSPDSSVTEARRPRHLRPADTPGPLLVLSLQLRDLYL